MMMMIEELNEEEARGKLGCWSQANCATGDEARFLCAPESSGSVWPRTACVGVARRTQWTVMRMSWWVRQACRWRV